MISIERVSEIVPCVIQALMAGRRGDFPSRATLIRRTVEAGQTLSKPVQDWEVEQVLDNPLTRFIVLKEDLR